MDNRDGICGGSFVFFGSRILVFFVMSGSVSFFVGVFVGFLLRFLLASLYDNRTIEPLESELVFLLDFDSCSSLLFLLDQGERVRLQLGGYEHPAPSLGMSLVVLVVVLGLLLVVLVVVLPMYQGRGKGDGLVRRG